jgi:hypothetical protein
VLGHGHTEGSEDAVVAVEGTLKARVRANKLRGFLKAPDEPLSVVLAQKAAKKAWRGSGK